MEWIMIKVRVGKETFCKWGRGGGMGPFFLGDRHSQVADEPLLPLSAELLFPRREGKCGSIHWALETHPGSRGLL